MKPVAICELHFSQGSLIPGSTGCTVNVEGKFLDLTKFGLVNMNVTSLPKHFAHTYTRSFVGTNSLFSIIDKQSKNIIQ